MPKEITTTSFTKITCFTVLQLTCIYLNFLDLVVSNVVKNEE